MATVCKNAIAHALGCVTWQGQTTITSRHHAICNALRDEATIAGFNVQREVAIGASPQSKTNDTSVPRFMDLVITGGSLMKPLYVDVTVVRDGVGLEKPGVDPATAVKAVKAGKYNALAEANGANFATAAFYTGGGMCDDSRKLMARFANEQGVETKKEVFARVGRVAATENGMLILKAIQQTRPGNNSNGML